MAVLVGVLAPQYLSYIHKAKVAADQANLKNYYTEIQLDYASTGVFWDVCLYFLQKQKKIWHLRETSCGRQTTSEVLCCGR